MCFLNKFKNTSSRRVLWDFEVYEFLCFFPFRVTETKNFLSFFSLRVSCYTIQCENKKWKALSVHQRENICLFRWKTGETSGCKMCSYGGGVPVEGVYNPFSNLFWKLKDKEDKLKFAAKLWLSYTNQGQDILRNIKDNHPWVNV